MNRDYRVGMFTFLGIVILCVLILWYGEEPSWFLSTRYELAVVVDNPSGIGVGTPAFMQGVQVGRVEDIRFLDPSVPSKGAAVIIGVGEAFDIPQGSMAAIHPAFAFDKGAIHIHPPLRPTEALPRGRAQIPGEMKGALDSVVPEEFVATLVAAVDQIGEMVVAIKNLANEVTTVSTDVHELLRARTLAEVDGSAGAVQANVYTTVLRLDSTLKSINELLAKGGELDSAVANIDESTRHLAEWSGNLDQQTDRLVSRTDETLSTIQRRSDEVSGELLEVLGRASRLLDQAHGSLAAINQGTGTLGKLLYDPKLYEEVLLTVDRLGLLVNDLRELKVWFEEQSILKGL